MVSFDFWALGLFNNAKLIYGERWNLELSQNNLLEVIKYCNFLERF